MRIEVKLSKTALLETGQIKPLILKATATAKVMERALYDQFNIGGRGERVTFSRKGRSYIPDTYMRELGTRFANRTAWVKIAGGMPPKTLYLSEGGGAWSWRNAQTWHDIARKNDATYNRTGGMWAGMQVRNYGTFGAVIEFAGQSVGQAGGTRKKRGRLKEGEKRGEEWTPKVANRLKAWTVFKEHSVLVVAPDRATQAALEDAIEEVASNWSQILVGGKVQPADRATSALAREFAKAMVG